jgi:uncharacterized membrane protein (DUF485 family)
MRSVHEMLQSPDFKQLVRGKWIVSVILTLLLFLLYYGYILLVAVDKPFLARKIGDTTTLGIPLGVGVIVFAWVLTGAYVLWANGTHDAAVRKLRQQLRDEK